MPGLDEHWVYDPLTTAFQRADTLGERELAAAWRAGMQLLTDDEFRDLVALRVQAHLAAEHYEAARWN